VSKNINNFVSKSDEKSVHVAVREIKEESYRALRWAGYSWGQAQSAGRISGVAEIIWGNGISAAVADAKRIFVTKRPVKVKQDSNAVLLNTRGLSTTMAAAFAVAISQSQPDEKVFVKGSNFGPEVAAAVWDVKRKPKKIITWGKSNPENSQDLSIMENGDLVAHSRLKSMEAIPSKFRALWFVICHEESPSGDVIMEKKEQVRKMNQALTQGVEVSKSQWKKLCAKSYKFLVPE
jgi:hypothetical protein